MAVVFSRVEAAHEPKEVGDGDGDVPLNSYPLSIYAYLPWEK